MNKSYIPNSFTFGNLAFGILSIIFTMKGDFNIAAFAIVAAAILDRYDGRIARAFNASSKLGTQLDSLADLVSFGVAPSILGWALYLNEYGIIGYIIVCLFPICGSFRLARYNVSEFNNVFMGVPITIAGFLMAIDSIIYIYVIKHGIISAILLVLFSYLMVSKIQIKKR
ncbi:CDP-diacylglycerol--serine O-phosphatidyltransferase [Clostridium cylindrosporum]|nr:CDP-diacylglycerol--serine O-phosphatidyltransferase [Clostridium cylindrosporum]